MRILLVFLFALSLLTGCATAPVEETRAFDNAVVAIKDAGDLLLDAVSAAERRTYVANLKKKKGAYAFSTADAPYFATVGDPRNVAAYRQSLNVLKQYSALLLSLAQGDDVSTIHASYLSLAGTVSAAAKATQFVPYVQALSPFIDAGLKAQSTAEARRIALQGLPVVRNLLTAFHDHAGDMFSALLADRALANAPASTINADRVMVANFVVVLESLQTTLDQLALAYSRKSSPATLATLVAASSQLAADVASARKTYEAMRGT